MVDTMEIFYQQYHTDVTRERFAKLDELLLVIADEFDFQPKEWMCLMQCLNGVNFERVFTLQPGIIEMQVVDTAVYEPEQFSSWEVDVQALKAKIQPLNSLQRLALCYKVHWLFELPDDECSRRVWPEEEGD